MSEEKLWSTRNVAEYAYCTRLFYFMEVEGIFIPSDDTEHGIYVHRRVDKPSEDSSNPNDESSDPDRPKVVRSLALISKTLGITATLDLCEISGNSAVPVEYRKGRPKRISISPPPEDPDDAGDKPLSNVEPWPTDKVQVMLQAILLQEAGYQVSKAVLYYAAEKTRVEIPIDDASKAEALSILKEAKECAEGSRPLPLVNDAKCVRCSLQQICLPDEVNQQRTKDGSDELTPRKIWPPCDEGIHVVAQMYGAKIGVNCKTMRVTNKDGKVLKEVPLSGVESLSICGAIQITTQAIHALSDMGIPVAFLSAAGRLVAIIDPLDSVSAEVRRAQIRKFDSANVCLELARAVITTKIMNQRTLLMRNHPSLPQNVADDLADEAKKADRASSIDSVRGHEGQAAAIYFKYLPEVFKGNAAVEFAVNGRKRRPPPDPINACLSLAYSLLVHECVAALRLARLEPSIGAFHASKPARPSLALDIMEPFRPLVSDSIAITLFNKGEISGSDFHQTAAGCALTNSGRSKFFNAYGVRMDTVITHPVFEYRLSYRRMIILHARIVAAWLMGEIPSLAFLTTR